MKSLCVYCGANFNGDPKLATAVSKLTFALSKRGIKMVYGGGRVGVMGMLADEMLKYGGEVTGIIPRFLTHDPTSLNKQGADKGTQYRSIVLYQNDEEKLLVEKVLNELQEVFDKPIVTEIVPFVAFYKAEEVHQNYYAENADAMYCRFVITPKLAKYRQLKEKLKLADQLKT